MQKNLPDNRQKKKKQQFLPKKQDFIAVSAGNGLTDIFKELGSRLSDRRWYRL